MDLLLNCENLIVIVYWFSSGEAEAKLFCSSQSYLYTITESSFLYYWCYCMLKKGALKENLGSFFYSMPLFTTMIFLEVISSISLQKRLYVLHSRGRQELSLKPFLLKLSFLKSERIRESGTVSVNWTSLPSALSWSTHLLSWEEKWPWMELKRSSRKGFKVKKLFL